MWPHQLQINLCQLAALASTIMVHSSNCLTNNGGARARGRARREHTPMLIGVPAPGTRFGLPGPCHPAFQRPGTPRRHLGSSACLKYPSCTAQHVCAVHLPWRLRNGCRLHHLNLQCRRRLVVSERCPAVYGSCSWFSVPRLCARVEPPAQVEHVSLSAVRAIGRPERSPDVQRPSFFTAPHWLMAHQFCTETKKSFYLAKTAARRGEKRKLRV
jgi:hypothetical protein